MRWSIALYLLAWSIWLIVQTWTNIRLAGEQSEPTLINLDWLHGLLFIVAWCTSCVVITSAVNEHIRRVQVPIDRLRWEQESNSESAQQMTDYVRSLPANKAGSRLDNVPARSPRIVEERSYPDPPKCHGPGHRVFVLTTSLVDQTHDMRRSMQSMVRFNVLP